MNRKTRRAMFIAGAMMIVLLIFNFMTSTPEAPPPTTPGEGGPPQPTKPEVEDTTPVVVAAMTIPKQKKITAEMIKVVTMPVSLKHTDAATESRQVLDHYSLVNIFAKEQVLLVRLGESSSAEVGMSYVISRGKRAISIPMTEDRAVGGYISPGKYVDIIGTFKLGTGTVTRPVMRRKRILAINEKYVIDKTGSSPAPAAPPTGEPAKGGEAPKAEGFQRIEGIQAITLEVTPEEGEKLTLAAANSQLALEIVHPDAPEEAGPPVTNDMVQSTIVNKPTAPGPSGPGPQVAGQGPPPRPLKYGEGELGPNGEIPTMNVQIIRGTNKGSQSVPLNIPSTNAAWATTGATAVMPTVAGVTKTTPAVQK